MVTRTHALTAIILYSAQAHAMSTLERDLQTLDFLCEAKAKGSYGFQGCAKKATCGMQGYYLAQYSPEGLCEKCELAEFPKRFIACLFCRRPIKKAHDDRSFSCLDCRKLAENALVDQLKFSDEPKYTTPLQTAAFKYVAHLKEIARENIPGLIDPKIRGEIFGAAAGFRCYLGAQKLPDGSLKHIWAKELKIREDKKPITTRIEADAYVHDICTRYDIIGPETGTLLAELPDEELIFYKEAR